MMSNEEISEKLHEISAYLLKTADERFKEAGIGYVLDAGTLLGAIRHKNFIPWDDDADIAMMREDYEKFLKVAKDLFCNDVEIVIPGEAGDEAFYDFVPKIIYKKAYIDKGSEEDIFYGGKYSHPSLDIFVIDKVPDSIIGQKIHTVSLIFVYGLAMGHRKKIDFSKYSGAEKIVIGALSFFGKALPLHTISAIYDKIACMFKNKEKKHVMSTHSAMDHFGDVYKLDWYKEKTFALLGEKEFPVPKGYDGILKKHYNNYMALPPAEQRAAKHIDFSKIEFEE